MPTFASDHNGIDPIDHLQNHLRQAEFWVGQGQWVAAFNQPICTSELTWQTILTHWLFVEGGGMIVIASSSLMVLWLLRRKILQLFQRSIESLWLHRTSYT